MVRRRCQYCGSHQVARSWRRGLFETLVLPALLQRPFRCLRCYQRYYGFAWAQTISVDADHAAPVFASALWIAHRAHWLIPFLGVPLVLAGTGVHSWVQLRQPSGSSQSLSRSDGSDSHAAKALLFVGSGSQWGAIRSPDISSTNAVGIGGAHELKGPTLSSLGAQQQTRRPLGPLNTSGDVYLNNSPAPAQSTIFAGDTVRTGSTGKAIFTLSGQGSLGLLARTEVSFVDQPQYIADLHYGTVSIHFLAEGKNLALKVSDFAVLAEPSIETNAEVDRTADGSARISCQSGSVGVIALTVTGPQALFLKPGQSATISPAGELRAAPSGPAAPSPVPPTTAKKSKAGWIALGLAAAGGAAGAAVALASGGGHRAVSPSVP
jgi:hypothetical protein